MTTVTNYINYSQQIDQWSALNTTVDTGISDPNGGTDAQRVNFNASGSYRIINADTTINAGESATGSIWVRNPTSSAVNIRVARKPGIGAFESTSISVPLTSQWTRIEVTHTYSNNQSGSRFDITGNSGSVEVFGAQLEYNVPQASNYYVLTTTDAPRTVDLTTLTSGWGAKTWSASEWGDLSDETVVVSSVAAQTSVGDFVTQGNADVEPTTVSATFTIEGAVAGASALVEPTGIGLNIVTGNEEIGIGVPVTGSSASTSINGVTIDDAFLIGEGWGRETWGSFAWGDNYSVLLNGISLSAVIGNEDAFTDVTAAVSGQELQTAITPVGTSANSDNEIAVGELLTTAQGDVITEATALVEPSGISLQTEISQVEAAPKQEVDVTGLSITTNIGNSDQIGTATVDLTGIGLSANLGTVTPVSKYEPGSVSATISAGQVTVTGTGVVIPTGVTLTMSTISPNIIAWSEVDTGTEVTWTDVDLAA